MTGRQLVAELDRIRDLIHDSDKPVILHIGNYGILQGTIQIAYWDFGDQELRINVRLSDDSIHNLQQQGFQITQEQSE